MSVTVEVDSVGCDVETVGFALECVEDLLRELSTANMNDDQTRDLAHSFGVICLPTKTGPLLLRAKI